MNKDYKEENAKRRKKANTAVHMRSRPLGVTYHNPEHIKSESFTKQLRNKKGYQAYLDKKFNRKVCGCTS
ncbi:MAG: hypothetical protein ACUZ8H_01545 [Candidatus Anammoxibacter sp.]